MNEKQLKSISSCISLHSILKESITEQRKLFTFGTDGYMCINKLTLLVDLVFRISKKLNELYLEGNIISLTHEKKPDSYYRNLYQVHRFNEYSKLCIKMRNRFNEEQEPYKRAKLYFDYTHYKGCIQNIITSDEFELICTYIISMINNTKNKTLRLLLNELSKDDIMLINPSIITNLFDHMDELYTKIQLPVSLKINIGTYYERYKNETDLNDYKYYYMFITQEYFNEALYRMIKDFNKRYAYVFSLR